MTKKALLFLFSLSLSAGLMAQPYVYNWGAYFGGIGEDVIRAISVDDDGNTYTTGYFTDNSDFDPGSGEIELTSNGFYDIFIQKLDTDGNAVWAKSYGSEFFDYGTGIETDGDGNIYVTGVIQETVDFNPEGEPFELTSAGSEDIFVLKLSPDGDFLWAGRMGGEGYEEPTSIGIDANGAMYVTGYFSQPGDFDPGETEYELTSNGGQDGFIVKLDGSGSFQWAYNFGGTEQLLPLGMDVNDFGDVFLTGPFQGTVDFDPGEGEEILELDSGQGGFVLKLNAAGEFGYAVAFGGDQNDTPWDIAIDSQGNAYSAGGFRGEFVAGNTSLTSVDFNEEAFVVKVNPIGGVDWAKAIQGDDFQNAYDVNTDQSGNVFLAGYFSGTADFNPNEGETLEFTKESTEPFDAFYAVLNSDGNFVHAGQFGGSNFLDHHGVDTDADGNIYLGAAFQQTVDLNPDPEETANATVVAFRDSYVVKLSPDDFVGVDYYANAPELSVFPNPAADVLNIDVPNGNSTYSIRDMAGREVGRGIQNSAKLLRISVSDLAPGAYVILVDGYAPVKWIKK